MTAHETDEVSIDTAEVLIAHTRQRAKLQSFLSRHNNNSSYGSASSRSTIHYDNFLDDHGDSEALLKPGRQVRYRMQPIFSSSRPHLRSISSSYSARKSRLNHNHHQDHANDDHGEIASNSLISLSSDIQENGCAGRQSRDELARHLQQPTTAASRSQQRRQRQDGLSTASTRPCTTSRPSARSSKITSHRSFCTNKGVGGGRAAAAAAHSHVTTSRECDARAYPADEQTLDIHGNTTDYMETGSFKSDPPVKRTGSKRRGAGGFSRHNEEDVEVRCRAIPTNGFCENEGAGEKTNRPPSLRRLPSRKGSKLEVPILAPPGTPGTVTTVDDICDSTLNPRLIIAPDDNRRDDADSDAASLWLEMATGRAHEKAQAFRKKLEERRAAQHQRPHPTRHSPSLQRLGGVGVITPQRLPVSRPGDPGLPHPTKAISHLYRYSQLKQGLKGVSPGLSRAQAPHYIQAPVMQSPIYNGVGGTPAPQQQQHVIKQTPLVSRLVGTGQDMHGQPHQQIKVFSPFPPSPADTPCHIQARGVPSPDLQAQYTTTSTSSSSRRGRGKHRITERAPSRSERRQVHQENNARVPYRTQVRDAVHRERAHRQKISRKREPSASSDGRAGNSAPSGRSLSSSLSSLNVTRPDCHGQGDVESSQIPSNDLHRSPLSLASALESSGAPMPLESGEEGAYQQQQEMRSTHKGKGERRLRKESGQGPPARLSRRDRKTVLQQRIPRPHSEPLLPVGNAASDEESRNSVILERLLTRSVSLRELTECRVGLLDDQNADFMEATTQVVRGGSSEGEWTEEGQGGVSKDQALLEVEKGTGSHDLVQTPRLESLPQSVDDPAARHLSSESRIPKFARRLLSNEESLSAPAHVADKSGRNRSMATTDAGSVIDADNTRESPKRRSHSTPISAKRDHKHYSDLGSGHDRYLFAMIEVGGGRRSARRRANSSDDTDSDTDATEDSISLVKERFQHFLGKCVSKTSRSRPRRRQPHRQAICCDCIQNSITNPYQLRCLPFVHHPSSMPTPPSETVPYSLTLPPPMGLHSPTAAQHSFDGGRMAVPSNIEGTFPPDVPPPPSLSPRSSHEKEDSGVQQEDGASEQRRLTFAPSAQAVEEIRRELEQVRLEREELEHEETPDLRPLKQISDTMAQVKQTRHISSPTVETCKQTSLPRHPVPVLNRDVLPSYGGVVVEGYPVYTPKQQGWLMPSYCDNQHPFGGAIQYLYNQQPLMFGLAVAVPPCYSFFAPPLPSPYLPPANLFCRCSHSGRRRCQNH